MMVRGEGLRRFKDYETVVGLLFVENPFYFKELARHSMSISDGGDY